MADIGKAIRLIADAKIEAAVEEGKFDKLPGFGKPFEFDDTRYDPYWWIRNKVKHESVQQIFNAAPQINPNKNKDLKGG
ncbi:MAG: DUF1992 domain-containing protein [Planctomycetota bacterium]